MNPFLFGAAVIVLSSFLFGPDMKTLAAAGMVSTIFAMIVFSRPKANGKPSLSPAEEWERDKDELEAGEIDLEEFVERWSGRRLPPRKVKASQEEPKVVFIENISDNNLRFFLKTPTFVIRPGLPVRVAGNELLCVVIRASEDGKDWVIRWPGGALEDRKGSELRIATPKAGEWWECKSCNSCWGNLKHTAFDAMLIGKDRIEGLPFVLCGCLHPVAQGLGPTHDSMKFMPGRWARFLGTLVQLVGRVPGTLDPWMVRFRNGTTSQYAERSLELAYPRKGECWERVICPECLRAPFGPMFLQEDHADWLGLVKCGCMKPINFGYGWAFGIGIGWPSIVGGGAGSAGDYIGGVGGAGSDGVSLGGSGGAGATGISFFGYNQIGQGKIERNNGSK